MHLHRPKYRIILAIATLFVVATSCNIRALLPEGQYVLTLNRVEEDLSTPKEERISAEEISKYIKQNVL